jgi:hypothetical protein
VLSSIIDDDDNSKLLDELNVNHDNLSLLGPSQPIFECALTEHKPGNLPEAICPVKIASICVPYTNI